MATIIVSSGGAIYRPKDGDVFIFPPDHSGPVRFESDADYTIEFPDSITGGSHNQVTTYGGGTATINVGAGVNLSRVDLGAGQNSAGETIVNVGDGATLQNFDASHSSGDLVIHAGNNVTVKHDICGPCKGGEGTYSFGDNAVIKGNFKAEDSGTTCFVAGDDFFNGGKMIFGGADDFLVLGDRYDVGYVKLGDGHDAVRLGYGGSSHAEFTGGHKKFEFDLISVAAPPGKEAAFAHAALKANWKENADGTYSPNVPSNGNYDPRHYDFKFGGSSFINFEGHAGKDDFPPKVFPGPDPLLTIEPAPGTGIDPATGNPFAEENGQSAQLVITRNGPTDEPLVVTLTDGDPSETAAPQTVTIPAGQSSVIVTVPSVDDTEVDGPQISTITASAPGFPPAAQDVTVLDDDLPTITVAPAPGSAIDPATGNPLTAENGAPAQIVITRDGPLDQPLTVTLNDSDPSETNAPTTVTIPAGQASVTVDVPSVDDPDFDGPQISTISASAPGYNPGGIDVTVQDDDVPALTIAPAPGSPIDPATGNPLTQENGAPAVIVVTREGPTDQPLVVMLTDGDPTETAAPVTVVIPAGQSSVVVPVPPVDDPDIDGPQVSTISATAPGYSPGGIDVTVLDDDVPGLTITPAPGTPVDPATGNPLTRENGEPAQIVITRDGPTDQPLVVTLDDGDPTETNAPTTVTIPAGQDSIVVDVPPVDDPDVDGPQVSTITATAPGFNPDAIDVTVEDDDVPGLTVTPAPGTPIDPATGNPLTKENGEPAQIVITREGPTDQPLVVTLDDGDPTETNAPTTVTIPAGQDSIVVDVPPVDDPDVDGPQVSTITATAPGFTPDAIDVTVEDDDLLPALTVEPAPGTPIDPATGNPLTRENGEPAQILITREGPTDEPLLVLLSDDDPTETDVQAFAVIPAGQSSVVVDVPPVDDSDIDGPQISNITATATGFTPDSIDVTVEDDDDVPPALTIEPAPGTPVDPVTGNPLTKENGDPAQVVITREGPTDQPLLVELTNGDPTETNAQQFVVIPAGQDSVIVDVPPVDDTDIDGPQDSIITATADGFTPDDIVVTVEDDDVPGLTITPAPGTPVDPLTGNPLTKENGDPAQIVITRDGPTDQPLVVTLDDGDPSETNAPTTVTIPAGQDSIVVDVPPVDDTEVDGPQVSTITATAPGLTPDTIDVTVEDDDVAPPPALSIHPAPGTPTDPVTGNPLTKENGDPAQIIIRREGPTDEPLMVELTNGDPSETDAPQFVVIPAGQDSVIVDVPPVDDTDIDGPQDSTITATADGFTPDDIVVTVEDDDVAPTPALSIHPAPGTPIDPATGNPLTKENGDPAQIIIRREGPTDQPLMVELTDSDPSETDAPLFAIIPAGQDSVIVDIPPVDDQDVDGPQISTISATADGFTPADIDVTVEDDDVVPQEPLKLIVRPGPDIVLDEDDRPTLIEGGQPGTLIVERTGPVDEDLVVFINIADDTEATPQPAAIRIPAGSSTAEFQINPVDDPIVDGPQFPQVDVTSPGYESVNFFIRVDDNDTVDPGPAPTLSIHPAPGTPIDPATGNPLTKENGDPAQIVIRRDGPTDQPLVVTLGNGDPTETDAPPTVTIPAGQSSVTVDVPPVDDSDVDGTQISTITATAPDYTGASIDVSVEDDDVVDPGPGPSLSIHPAPGTPIDPATGKPVTKENGEPAQIVIKRDGPVDHPLVVNLSNGDPSETNAPALVLIPAGQSSVTVDVPPVDDDLVDGTQVSTITASSPGFISATQDVLVEDDDGNGIVGELIVKPGDNLEVDENGLPRLIEGGEPGTVIVMRTGPVDGELVVFVNIADDTEATPAPTAIRFPAGSDTATFQINPVDDTIVDGPQFPQVDVSAEGYENVSFLIRVDDNDTGGGSKPNGPPVHHGTNGDDVFDLKPGCIDGKDGEDTVVLGKFFLDYELAFDKDENLVFIEKDTGEATCLISIEKISLCGHEVDTQVYIDYARDIGAKTVHIDENGYAVYGSNEIDFG